MKSIGRIALAAGAVALTSHTVSAAVVYNFPRDAGFGVDQQWGNAATWLGDDATLAGGTAQIGTIAINFQAYANDPFSTIQYTPHLTAMLFDIDSNGDLIDSNTSDTLLYTPFASASNNATTFTGFDYGGGKPARRDNSQYVTFDFTSQNVSRSAFVFAYYDTPTVTGERTAGNGFSVLVSTIAPATTFGTHIGTTRNGYYSESENGSGYFPFTYGFRGDGDTPSESFGIEATINAAVVPEPASLGLLALGGLAAIRRRK